MKIEVLQCATGLLFVHVLGRERLACEAAYNRFLVNHNLKHWDLVVRTNLLDQSIVAQSVDPDGQVSQEMVIADSSDIRERLTALLEAELDRWMQRSQALEASDIR